MGTTPKAALEALAAPAPLTLGQVALLELEGCPLARGDCSSVYETARALWLLGLPREEAARRRSEAADAALPWLDEIGVGGYRERLAAALAALDAFWRMVPPADEAEKKTSAPATAG